MLEKPRILLIDDQLELQDYIIMFLEGDGYEVLTAWNGVEALKVLEQEHVDLIMADIGMPKMNGYQLYETVIAHPQWIKIPFIFLSGRSMDSDIRYGKSLGVDDYLIKPVEPADLLATVRGKLRRGQELAQLPSRFLLNRPSGADRIYCFGDLKIDPAHHQVWLAGEAIKLSSREFKLIEYLARQPNRAVPMVKLVEATHNITTDQTDASNLLRPMVRSLRRKLGYETGEMGCIENMRGVGYMLVTPVQIGQIGKEHTS